MGKKNNHGKKFRCDRCEYEATRSDNLKRHVRSVHAKEKDFKCELCEYAARQPSDLKRHVLAVHDKMKKFTCE